ncbi:MAG: hypothetical protein PHE24_05795 [Patescibacteria group bacterium]|nr:hypothetical protein [Patescibacteria group bacterium]
MKNKSLLKHPYKFAAIGGAFWGLTLFLSTLISTATGYGAAFLNMVGGIYPGYEISFSGSINALFFGFMDGFIICFLIAYFSGGSKKVKSKK